MDSKFIERENTDMENEEKEIEISKEDIKKAKVNPFRADALKSMAKFAGITVAMGLACKFTNVGDLPYFNMILFAIEGNLSVKMVRDLVNYFNYKRYRKDHKIDMNKNDFLNEQAMVYKTIYHQNKR